MAWPRLAALILFACARSARYLVLVFCCAPCLVCGNILSLCSGPCSCPGRLIVTVRARASTMSEDPAAVCRRKKKRFPPRVAPLFFGSFRQRGNHKIKVRALLFCGLKLVFFFPPSTQGGKQKQAIIWRLHTLSAGRPPLCRHFVIFKIGRLKPRPS